MYGPEESVVELVKIVARMLPHSVEWEPANEKFEFNHDTRCGSWRSGLKPIGRIDENLMAHFDRDAIANLNLAQKGPEE